MSATSRTGLYVGAAALLAIVALVTTPGLRPEPRFEDEGELFLPGFTDPAQASSLEVVEVDEATASARVFKVQRKDGRWTIPSHHDYPADAKERMADAAGLLIGLRKGAVRSDSRADQAALGVVDPLDPEPGLEGRGMLVTFRGEGDRELGRLILGKAVEGRPGQLFVRIPGQRRTYTASIAAKPGTRFADWVETDLLKLSSRDIEKLVFDNYSVDEEARVVRPGERIVVTRRDGAWAVEGQEDGEEPNAEKLDAAGRALDDLKIVGVRRKPEGLTDRLETAQGFELEVLARSLEGRGFFLTRDRLYSNEGDLLVTTRDGVRTTLRFGEIVSGSAEEASAGKEEEKAGKDGGEAGKPGKDARPNRYLMVTVDLDESVLARPEGAAIEPGEVSRCREAIREIEEVVRKVDGRKESAGAPPETLAEAIGDDERLAKDPWEHPYLYERTEGGYRVTSLGRDGEAGGEGADGDLASDGLEAARRRLDAAEGIRAYEEKVKKGRTRVAELQARFAPWYYVIDAGLFDRLKLSRGDVLKAREEERSETPGGGEAAPPEPGKR